MVQQIMLALHCKKTEAVDLKSPIWQYISNTYSPEQARITCQNSTETAKTISAQITAPQCYHATREMSKAKQLDRSTSTLPAIPSKRRVMLP
jgi:hypothetical protein